MRPVLTVAALLLVLVLSVTPAGALEPLRVALSASLYGRGAQSDSLENRSAGALIGAAASYVLAPWARGDLSLEAIAETGSYRGLYSPEFEPRQGLSVREATVSVSPWPALTLIAGAMDQDRWAMRMVIHDQSFPAVAEVLSGRSGAFRFRISALQSFATDTQTLVSTARRVSQAAVFLLERLELEVRPVSFLEAAARVSHFAFDNLSPEAAYRSRFLGNSVDGIGAAVSRFRYGYQGWEAGGDVRVRLARGWQWRSFVEWAQNERAAASTNGAFRFASELSWEESPSLIIAPRAEYFHIGADTTPALFGNRAYGRTNRRGYAVGARITFPKDRIELMLRYFDARVLAPAPYLSDLRWAEAVAKVDFDAL